MKYFNVRLELKCKVKCSNKYLIEVQKSTCTKSNKLNG